MLCPALSGGFARATTPHPWRLETISVERQKGLRGFKISERNPVVRDVYSSRTTPWIGRAGEGEIPVREYFREVEIAENLALDLSGIKNDRTASEGAVIYRLEEEDWLRIGRVGYNINFTKRVVYWCDFFLHEEWRRRGIGIEVYQWIENHLIDDYGIRTIYLIMPEEESMAFWEKMGFGEKWGFAWNRKDLDKSK